MINNIHEMIGKFIDEWLISPYEWETERDIQVDIASRIKITLKENNLHLLKASYDGKTQRYNRVSCEPRIYVKEESDERYSCRPDIVVYDDIENCDSSPDEVAGNNWPMLWVCEIKYLTEWAGDFHSDNRQWDIDKACSLLRQTDGTKYASCLNFYRNVNARNKTGVELEERENGRLKIYKITYCST